MDAKWTPGPWQVRYGDQIFSGDNRNLADVWTEFAEVTWKESSANAHLIAAAPDMAAALDMVDAMFSHPGKINKTTVRDVVRAVLAKARGEA